MGKRMRIRRVYCHFGCGYQQQQGAECNNIKNEKKFKSDFDARQCQSVSQSVAANREIRKKTRFIPLISAGD
jgi:hypothetical protein